MFKTETKAPTSSYQRAYGHAVCDRCGHVMDEADHKSGYQNLTMLRFRAAYGSKFGEGRCVEGDFCDACLFELLAPYVRVIDDSQLPDSTDFFRILVPRRLYLEHQIAGAMAEGILMTLGDWIAQCFDPTLTRRKLVEAPGTTATGGGSPPGA